MTIINLVNSYDDKPEVIAVCQQEATKNKETNQTLGRDLLSQLDGYDYLEEHKIVGITKVSKGTNFTNITVLVTKDFYQEVEKGSYSKGHERFDLLKATKGVVWVKIEFPSQEDNNSRDNLILGCAHLDASSTTKRTKGLKKAKEVLSALADEPSIAFGGDLNYRTDQEKLALNNDTDEITVDNFINNYLNYGKNGFLYLFDASSGNQELEEEGFQCAGFHDSAVYPPTYKMAYKNEEDRKACADYSELALDGLASDERYEAARACYFSSQDPSSLVGFKNGELNIGYLDRICTLGDSIEKRDQGSLEIFESDHRAIWSFIEF